jgi:hypothetical protein
MSKHINIMKTAITVDKHKSIKAPARQPIFTVAYENLSQKLRIAHERMRDRETYYEGLSVNVAQD